MFLSTSVPEAFKTVTRYRPVRATKKKRPLNGGWLISFLLMGATGWTIWHSFNGGDFRFIQEGLLANLPEQVQQSVNPNTLLRTQQVDNPVPGNAFLLSASEGKRLDQLARQIRYSGTSVEELAVTIRPFAKSDAEKARLAYSWITQNIAYDVPMAETRNIDDLRPETVLARGETICSGYANLFQTLAKHLGLDAVIIEGYAKGGDFIVGDDPDVNHAWNGVKIDGVWYLVDTTWGAGTVSNGQFKAKFNPYYFATPPREFLATHFPRRDQWQLMPTPIARTEFDQRPQLSPRFFRDQLALVSHPTAQIRTGGNIDITVETGEGVQLAARLQAADGEPLDESYTLSQVEYGQGTVSVSFPAPGNYTLLILSKKSNEQTYYQAIAYDIAAQGSGVPFPKSYGTFTEKQAALISPRRGALPINQASFFQLRVPGAEAVYIVDQSRRQNKKLTRAGDMFTGSEVVRSPNVIVAAKFPDSNKLWSLLAYE